MSRIKKETQRQIADLLQCQDEKQWREYLNKLTPIQRTDITVGLIKQRIKKPKRIK